MGRKTRIAIITLAALLLIGVAAGYAYDSSEKDKIADGVTVGGVDVGGMDEAEAEQAVRRQLLGPLKHSLRVGYDGESWTLPGKSLKVHADIDAAIEEALDESSERWVPGPSGPLCHRRRRRRAGPRRRHLLEAGDQPFRAPGRRRSRSRSAGRLGRTKRRFA